MDGEESKSMKVRKDKSEDVVLNFYEEERRSAVMNDTPELE